MKVALVGTIDTSHTEVSGQYDRTEIILNGLKDAGYDVKFVNMMNWTKRPLKIFLQIIRFYFECDKYIFIASLRGCRLNLGITNLLRLIKRKPIYQIAIGGASNCYFLQKEPFYRNIVNKLEMVFVEVLPMIEEYKRLGVTNTDYLPNCKEILQIVKLSQPSISKPFRFCTYSRVTPTKGIKEAIDAVKYLNNKYGKGYCTLDIYGTYLDQDKNWFNALMLECDDSVSYKARINREDSIKVLGRYDMMLFFTTHSGEGIPGALIDCFEAGLPVAACDTSFLRALIKNSETGYLFSSDNIMNMIEKIELYTEHLSFEERFEMRKNCVNAAQQFDTKSVIQKLSQYLNK